MTNSVLGIIGGSGLYDMPSLKRVHWQTVDSPWGEASDQILFAEIDGLPLRFLPRHGRGHKVPPSAIILGYELWQQQFRLRLAETRAATRALCAR